MNMSEYQSKVLYHHNCDKKNKKSYKFLNLHGFKYRQFISHLAVSYKEVSY